MLEVDTVGLSHLWSIHVAVWMVGRLVDGLLASSLPLTPIRCCPKPDTYTVTCPFQTIPIRDRFFQAILGCFNPWHLHDVSVCGGDCTGFVNVPG